MAQTSEWWMFGMGLLLRWVLYATVLAFAVYIVWKQSGQELLQRSSVFLAAWLMLMALYAFDAGHGVILSHVVPPDPSKCSTTEFATSTKQALGLALKYMLPAYILTVVIGASLLAVRRRWIAWTVAAVTYTGICVYLGYLDAIFSRM